MDKVLEQRPVVLLSLLTAAPGQRGKKGAVSLFGITEERTPCGRLLLEEDGQEVLRRPHGCLVGVHDEDVFVHLEAQFGMF